MATIETFRIKLVNYMHQTFCRFEPERIRQCLKKKREVLNMCLRAVNVHRHQGRVRIRVDKQKDEDMDVTIFPHIESIKKMLPRRNRLELCVNVWTPPTRPSCACAP